MNKVWDLFENMNEIVYAADMDTYEVVYMNSTAKNVYGCKSNEDIKHRKCYEVLKGCSSPCSICNNQELKVNNYEEWEYYNPDLKKNFLVKATRVDDDGRRIRMEIAIDVSSVKKSEKETIKEYIDKETMINDGLKISLSSSNPELSISVFLEHIGKTIKCERVFVFDENDGFYSCSYEWFAEGEESQKSHLQNIPKSEIQQWLKGFVNDETVTVTRFEDAKFLHKNFVPKKEHIFVCGPLMYNNKIIGFYGADNPLKETLSNIKPLFGIMGHFLVALMRRRDLFRRLETLSYYDYLTGMKNRHAMHEYISDINKYNSIGVIYCDVMGLKKVNDCQGHQAGDELLIRASECIKYVFGEYLSFRIGGDEFLVLCADVKRDVFRSMVEKFKRAMPEYNAMMAVGSVWKPNSKYDIDKLITEADELMYKNKRKLYRES